MPSCKSNSMCRRKDKTRLLVERVAEVVGVEAPRGCRGGAGGGGSCKHKYTPAPRAPGGGWRGGGGLWGGPVAAEGNALGRERGPGDEPRSTSRRGRHAYESRSKARHAATAEEEKDRRRAETYGRTESRINQAQQVTCANLQLWLQDCNQ